jgi:predicted AlkP superfamily phosphohydrolase/phosphomutase
MKRSRIFVVGLDGATWKVLSPLISKGKLPFLKKLKESGTSGVLESTVPPLTAPAWVTFQTGVNPGKHGIFGFLNYRKEKPDIFDSRDIKAETIWEILGDQSLKSLIINMPVTYPLKQIKGAIVSSFLTPPGSSFVYPKKLQKKLESIDYEIDILVTKKYGELQGGKLSAEEKKELLDKLVTIAEKRIEAFKVLSQEDDFSFLFLLFKETDLVQHLFWGKKELEIFYRKLDKILEGLFDFYIRNFEGEKNFLVISDHGFHKASVMEFAPYQWFQKEGLLKETRKAIDHKLWNKAILISKSLKKISIIPTELKVIKKIRNRVLLQGRVERAKKEGLLATPEGIYLLGTDVKEREEYADKISKRLKKLKYRNKFVFHLVEKSKKVYSGPYTEKAPDVVWVPTEHFSINTSPFASRIFTKRKITLQGEHIADSKGIFIANGMSFPKVANKKAEIQDIFPIILSLLKAKIPNNIDGKLPAFLRKNGVKMTDDRKLVKSLIEKEIKKITKHG